MNLGGTAPCIINAANEVAVQQFLEGKIGFLQIADIIGETLASIATMKTFTYEDLVASDEAARAKAQVIIGGSVTF
jgi:1-deoxy-D-xylulose-5-phosphate reductoisomerase